MKATTFVKLLVVSLASAFVSCEGGDPKKSAKGFRLPDGDIERGKTAFVALECHRCHSVDGVELAKFEGESPVSLTIGGEIRRVKNYGELVTSIINPDHVISKNYLKGLPEEEQKEFDKESPMPSFNEKMTVAQMIDLVAFLQSRYSEIVPDNDTYFYP